MQINVTYRHIAGAMNERSLRPCPREAKTTAGAPRRPIYDLVRRYVMYTRAGPLTLHAATRLACKRSTASRVRQPAYDLFESARASSCMCTCAPTPRSRHPISARLFVHSSRHHATCVYEDAVQSGWVVVTFVHCRQCICGRLFVDAGPKIHTRPAT